MNFQPVAATVLILQKGNALQARHKELSYATMNIRKENRKFSRK